MFSEVTLYDLIKKLILKNSLILKMGLYAQLIETL